MVKKTQQEREYEEKYGNISCDQDERLEFLINSSKNNKRKKERLLKLIEDIKNIEWEELEYIFYLIPKATPRPRLGKNNIFYVKGAKDNKEFFKRFAKYIDEFPIIYTPCTIEIDCYFPTPSSMTSDEKILAEMKLIRPISKPDFDNLAKTYCDMIQGTILDDDALIIDGTGRKYYSLKPRVELHIKYMKEFDSSFNKKKYLKKKGGI